MFTWLKELDGRERRTLIAAVAGWATDSVDIMVFIFVIPTLMAVWGMSKIGAGWITTVTVVSSAIAIGMVAIVGFAVVILVVALLPETRGKTLAVCD